MNSYSQSISRSFSLPSTYLIAIAFVIISVVVPQVMHQFSMAGTVFLPLLFFAFFATVRYGAAVGLLTAIASPVVSKLLTGMPPGDIIYVVLAQGVAISLIAGYFAEKSKSIRLYQIALVIVAYQLIGCTLDALLISDLSGALFGLKKTIPGMLIQLLLLTIYSEYINRRNA